MLGKKPWHQISLFKKTIAQCVGNDGHGAVEAEAGVWVRKEQWPRWRGREVGASERVSEVTSHRGPCGFEVPPGGAGEVSLTDPVCTSPNIEWAPSPPPGAAPASPARMSSVCCPQPSKPGVCGRHQPSSLQDCSLRLQRLQMSLVGRTSTVTL